MMRHGSQRSATQPVLRLIDVERRYQQAGRVLRVLDQVSFDLYPGEAVALVGPSGAGKSSLLHIAGLLEAPDGGAVLVRGQDCGKFSDKQRTRMRRSEIGFVYQFHHLLPEFSALENVVLPQLIGGTGKREARQRGLMHLRALGLGERADHRPAQMSGGEQQRVAVARALVNSPAVLLADEPTGNLDPETSERVFEELMALIRNSGLAALIATHNHELAGRMDRVLRLDRGKAVEMVASR